MTSRQVENVVLQMKDRLRFIEGEHTPLLNNQNEDFVNLPSFRSEQSIRQLLKSYKQITMGLRQLRSRNLSFG